MTFETILAHSANIVNKLRRFGLSNQMRLSDSKSDHNFIIQILSGKKSGIKIGFQLKVNAKNPIQMDHFSIKIDEFRLNSTYV